MESVVFEILGEEKNIISVEIDYLYGKNSCKIEFGDFENYEFCSRNKKEIEKKILEQYRTRKDKNFLEVYLVDVVMDIKNILKGYEHQPPQKVAQKKDCMEFQERATGDFEIQSDDPAVVKIFENIKKTIKKNR